MQSLDDVYKIARDTYNGKTLLGCSVTVSKEETVEVKFKKDLNAPLPIDSIKNCLSSFSKKIDREYNVTENSDNLFSFVSLTIY